MNKKMRILLAATAISKASFAYSWGLEIAGGVNDLVGSRGITDTRPISKDDTVEGAQPTGKNPETSLTSIQSFKGYNARVTAMMSVAENVHVGISTGYRFNLHLPTTPGSLTAKEFSDLPETLQNDAIYARLHTIPLMFGVKHDMFQPYNWMNLYINLRAGFSFTFLEGFHESGDFKNYTNNLVGGLFDLGVGLEIYGAQLELGYMLQALGGLTATTMVEGASEKANVSFNSHSLFLTLGYRFYF